MSIASDNNLSKFKDKNREETNEEEKEFKLNKKSKFGKKQESISKEEEESDFKNPFETHNEKTNTNDPFAPNSALKIGNASKLF
jgi:hypothetical protein